MAVVHSFYCTPITVRYVLTLITGEMFALSCFSRKVSVCLYQKVLHFLALIYRVGLPLTKLSGSAHAVRLKPNTPSPVTFFIS